ncbi:MAG: D-alanine--D-alanine ligase [Chloroflexi bacterium]|nr:D-alanine--D-alanine ligase [Chloroflexota bacterium]
MKRKLRVGILFGGKSGEHEVSLASAQSALDALDRRKFEPVLIGIDKQGRWLSGGRALRQLTGGVGDDAAAHSNGNDAIDDKAVVAREAKSASMTLRPSPLREVDVVFPILHGPLGEDGTVQGMLEMADIPYVGAGVAASAVGMDKELLKTIFMAHQLPIAPFAVVRRRDWERDADGAIARTEAQLPYPLFVKPANMGSSVGISKAADRDGLRRGIEAASIYDRKIIIEQGLNVREVECAVLGNDEPVVSVVGEIRTRRRDFYDYIAKYTDGEADLIIPADLPAETADGVRALAARAYRAIDCAGMARADFFIERETGKVYLNELNTIPGFTRFSMYPKLWEASGVSYGELVDRLIMLALERYADKKRSQL